MNCPNEACQGALSFYEETYDDGDPSTPYFRAGYYFLYDEEASEHVEGCVLTQKQIEELEDEYNKNPPEYDPY